jgi:hypothetical protein
MMPWPCQAAVFILVRAAVAGPHLGAVCDGRASRGQGDALLNLFYPDHDAFWLDYCRACRRCWRFCAAARQRSAPVAALRWLLVLRKLRCCSGSRALAERRTAHGLGLRCWWRIYGAVWLLPSRRLRACFRQR